MKKYISYLLTLALLVPAFVSCTEQLEDLRTKNQKTHTVYFSTTDRATKTGLSIDGNMVKPDWRKTDVNNIHFFEIDANNAAAPGTADAINLSDDNRTAHFKAAISEEVVIHIDPTTGEEDNSKGAKSSSRVSPFTFAAVVAQQPDKKAYTYVIPSEQHPDAETLKDPNAEFLVGYSRKSYPDRYSYDDNVVDLYFDRVAALGRLAISGFVGSGEKVKSVTITATGGMTGKATYPGDFTLGDKNKVKFTKVNEPLVLNYGDNGVAAPAEGAFYAYFVAAPGEASITSIEVLTDQYKYTKTVEGGASFTFSDEQLLNIDFALSADIAEAVTADNKTWYKASVLEAGYDYLIVSGGQALKNNNGETAALAVDPQDGVITFEGNVDPAIIWTATTYTGLEEYGHFTFSNGVKYLYRYSQTTTQRVSIGDFPDEVTKHYVWDYDGTYLYHVSSASDNRIYYCWYDGGWKTSNTGQMATALYTTRAPQTISFAGSGLFEYDLDDPTVDFEEPALGDHFGDVTYFSNDENLATVDPETGNVTFLKAGNVEITAIAAGDDSHQAARASYTIVITTDQLPTWYKADEIAAGEIYLIVSNGNALRNNNSTVAAVANEVFSGNSFQYNADDDLLWTATSVGELTNGGNYLRLTSSNNSYSLSIGSKSGTTSNNEWIYDSEKDLLHAVGGGNNQYVYYSTYSSTQNFTLSTSPNPGQSSAHNTTLYTNHPGLAPRNLSFGEDPVTVTHDLKNGTNVDEPELKGDSLEGVTYAVTEGTDVASVNANTGEVTLAGKTGSAVITASASKTNTYKAESVSYTLVVKDSNVPTKRYVLANSIVAGKKYLIVSEGHALKNNSGEVASEAVTPASNVIEIESGQETDLEWTALTENTQTSYGHFVLSNGGYRLNRKSSSGRFSVTFVSISTTMDKYGVWDLQEYNGVFYLYHDSSATMRLWLSYNSGWQLPYLSVSTGGDITNPTAANITNGPVRATQLYVEDDGGITPPTPEERDQTLSFPEASYTAQVGTAFTAPSVSGAQTTVTYTSSKETVATVNANTGAVTLVGPGETIITASAAAEIVDGISYKAASAQYTLTVNPASTPTTAYYQKVTSSSEFVQDGVYIIVNESNNKLFKPILNSSKTIFETTNNTINVSITDGKIASSSAVDACQIVLKNSDSKGKFALWIPSVEYYLQVYRNDASNTIFKAEADDNGYRSTFSVDGSGVASIYRDDTHYVHYSASNTAFQVGNNSSNIAVYKLVGEGGSTPGGGDDPTPTKTYTKVSSISAGTYLIGGTESSGGTYICAFPPSDNVCNHVNIGSSSSITSITSNDYSDYEVELIASGSNWFVKLKSTGQYMYTSNGEISFTTDESVAKAHAIGSSATQMTCASGSSTYYFYHSGSSKGFKYRNQQVANLCFYKLSDNP